MDNGKHKYLLAKPDTPTSSSGQPLLCVHGMSGFAAYLAPLMEYFAARGYVAYAPDIVGHGERSGDDLSGVGVGDYVADVGDFINRVVLPRHNNGVIIVGHSMGGLIAAKLAEGKEVTHVVLITPSPPKGVLFVPGGFIRFTWDDILSVIRRGIRKEPFVPSRKMFESLFADPERSKEVIDLWAARRISNESLLAALQLGTSQIRVNSLSITAPMLVVGAAKDVVIHPRVAVRIAAYFNADVHMLDTLGHMCPFEWGWEETADVILGWLKKNGATP